MKLTDFPTPFPAVDLDVMGANIGRVQAYFDKIGKSFRPHVKTHKNIAIGRVQIEAGARGINCQKLSEAKVFADAGFGDILVTYNIVGLDKLAALSSLANETKASVVADSVEVVAGLAQSFTRARPLTVLVECDTGGGRCGVQTPAEAFALAQAIDKAPGLDFGGILTYPAANGEEKTEVFFAETKRLIDGAGIDCRIASSAGSPSLYKAHLVPSANEYRAGTYVFNDRSMIRAGHCTLDQVALKVVATVVSRPTGDRAVLDAGSKSLTSDLLGFKDYGLLPDYPEARIASLSEEHAVVDLSAVSGARPKIGERVEIVPNHVCVVVNMFDELVGHRRGGDAERMKVAARGMVR